MRILFAFGLLSCTLRWCCAGSFGNDRDISIISEKLDRAGTKLLNLGKSRDSYENIKQAFGFGKEMHDQISTLYDLLDLQSNSACKGEDETTKCKVGEVKKVVEVMYQKLENVLDNAVENTIADSEDKRQDLERNVIQLRISLDAFLNLGISRDLSTTDHFLKTCDSSVYTIYNWFVVELEENFSKLEQKFLQKSTLRAYQAQLALYFTLSTFLKAICTFVQHEKQGPRQKQEAMRRFIEETDEKYKKFVEKQNDMFTFVDDLVELLKKNKSALPPFYDLNVWTQLYVQRTGEDPVTHFINRGGVIILNTWVFNPTEKKYDRYHPNSGVDTTLRLPSRDKASYIHYFETETTRSVLYLRSPQKTEIMAFSRNLINFLSVCLYAGDLKRIAWDSCNKMVDSMFGCLAIMGFKNETISAYGCFRGQRVYQLATSNGNGLGITMHYWDRASFHKKEQDWYYNFFNTVYLFMDFHPNDELEDTFISRFIKKIIGEMLPK